MAKEVWRPLSTVLFFLFVSVEHRHAANVGGSDQNILNFETTTEEVPTTPMGFFVNSGPMNITVQAGTQVTLHCRVENNVANDSVSWLKRNGLSLELLSLNLEVYRDDPRYQVNFIKPADWQLIINPVESIDEGRFDCQISSHPPMGYFVYLHVLEIVLNMERNSNAGVDTEFLETMPNYESNDGLHLRRSIANNDADLTENDLTISIQENSDVDISTEFSETTQNPVVPDEPSSNNTIKLPSNVDFEEIQEFLTVIHSSETGKLHLDSKQISDDSSLSTTVIYDGQLEHLEEDLLGVRKNITWTATYSQVPEIEILDERNLPIKNKFYNSGSTIVLKCNISKVPHPRQFIIWKHNSTILNYDTTRGGISVRTEILPDGASSLLFIGNVGPSDSGNYSCSLGPEVGTSVAVVVITGEKPAAMQHGSATTSASLGLLTILSAVLSAVS